MSIYDAVAPDPDSGGATYHQSDDFEYGYDDERPISSSSTVELTISCRGLSSNRLFSKPCPIVVVSKKGRRDWIECRRTEKVINAQDPDFAEKVTLDYNFHEVQLLRFSVYDNIPKEGHLSDDKLIGNMICTMGEIVKSQPRFTANIRSEGKQRPNGKIIVVPEQLQSCRDKVIMKWKASKLSRKDFVGKSDPFMVFYKQNVDGSYIKCYQTEVVKHTLDPTFKQIEIPVSTLCNGDYKRTIKVEVYDWNRSGRSDTIGMFTTNLERLSRGGGYENIYRCVNPAKLARKKSYKDSGTVKLVDFRIERLHTFVDFIRSGMEMSFIVAVDFSSSNIDQRWATSLHSHTLGKPSLYQQTIETVGNVIRYYDTDGLFPAFGFGAKLTDTGPVSDRFALNSNEGSPACEGIEGIVEAYHQSLKRVSLGEPTNLSPIIDHTSSLAAGVRDSSNYFVLLIITDGQISDLDRTKAAIFRAAKLPISIIIVGVGNGDFSDMNDLDGDTTPLTHQGARVDRDIVQFVPMREFLDPNNEDEPCDHDKLAKEVLEEVPDQLVKYMKSKGFKPA